MANLVSAEYSLKAFCDAMHGKNPMEVMDAACEEIATARLLHSKSTKRSDFRKGSKGREYCDSLQLLISLTMNGSIPDDATPTFLMTVKPLIDNLLKKWELGTLRQDFANVQQAEQFSLPDTLDPLVIVISRAEVDAMDTSAALTVLKRLLESPDTARAFLERVDIAFHGYDHINEELFEIPEVRNFVWELDQQFPFWLFFLSKRHLGLQCLLLCFLPPFLTEAGRAKQFPERINQLLTKRWGPAMGQMCEYVGFSKSQFNRLAERAMAYINNGRFPADEEPLRLNI